MFVVAFGFVHPALAASAAALAPLPVLIHLLSRRRFRPVRWAAMQFLQAAAQRTARRLRLEQLLLLALRIAIVVLMALAVARPYLGSAAPPATGSPTTLRIAILDNSLSMQSARPDTPSPFQLARSLILQLLTDARPPDQVGLITASRPAQIILHPHLTGQISSSQLLAQLEPSQARSDLPAALTLAQQMLDRSTLPPDSAAIYILTDGAAAAWAPSPNKAPDPISLALARLASRARLHLIYLGPADRPNLAVVSLSAQPNLLTTALPVPLLAEVANYASAPAPGLHLTVLRDGQAVQQIPLPLLQPGRSHRAHFDLSFDSPGPHLLQVRLSRQPHPDLLPQDDTRLLALSIRPALPVLLVDGSLANRPLHGHAGYLATALAPRTGPADQTPTTVQLISYPQLPTQPLHPYAIVGLCNVPRLDHRQWQRLAEFVRTGGGLMLWLGDQVDLDNYNHLGFADGRGPLPARLEALVQPTAGYTSFSPHRLLHPIVAPFAGHQDTSLFLARITRYIRCTPAQHARVALRYASGDPAIIERSFGRGTAAIVTTSADMTWTNLPARGDYVALTMSLAAYLAPAENQPRNLLVGDALLQLLTASHSTRLVHLQRPDGQVLDLAPQAGPDGLAVRYSDTDICGPYWLALGQQRVGFAVNPDPAESDLRRLDPHQLRQRLGSALSFMHNPTVLPAPPARSLSTELATPLLALLLALLAVETLLGVCFGHHHHR